MGEYGTVHRVADDPLETAANFREAGATHLHVVDLDGAKDGFCKNRALLIEIAAEFGGFCEIGGGIRDRAAAEDYLENGFSRVVLGSAAVESPDFLREMLKLYADRVAVGIDAKHGEVKTSGWTKGSGVHYLDFAKRCIVLGAKSIIYTDISRDGMLEGPSFEELGILNALGCEITASGGIRNLEDIRRLKEMGLAAAICGKSIYDGSLDLREALTLCGEV
jgi:phosphoribosylformimino-5-aminoimidazole carboxamide ribotide isomerase